MHQRQYRPDDVLDDFCPRERRITDHAIVAMVEGEIQRTRCVVCESEHEFKNARMPILRRKPGTGTLYEQVLDTLDPSAGRVPPAGTAAGPASAETASETTPMAATASPSDEASPDTADDRPFRRSLIRAQLPRPEGQPPPTRAIPEFTMHQPLNQNGKRPGQGRFRRRPGGGAPDHGGPMRSGREGNNAGGSGQGGRRRRRKKH